MPLAFLTFFSGLAISAVAIYYSVIGLAAIFAAAVIPIIIMGTILEVSKLVAAWWLKANWHRAPFLLKSYMLLAVVVLMLITSMGIFGFLSKAHTEQSVPVGDNQAKIEIIDERIAIEQEVIEQARRDLTILNQQVERFSELGAVTRGVNARNQQREERDALNAQIAEAQTKISELRVERAPFATSLRAIEAEVGPIKYIAKLIYGDNTDSSMLEQAVVWIIIVIVFVFDPLAILLLLASQMSFKWAREERELNSEPDAVIPSNDDATKDSSVEPVVTGVVAQELQDIIPEAVQNTTEILDTAKVQLDKIILKLVQQNSSVDTDIKSFTVPKVDQDIEAPKIQSSSLNFQNDHSDKLNGIDAWNKMIEDLEREVEEEKSQTYIQNEEQTESNLWQETRKNVVVEQNDSLTQEDYQKKVHQAIIRDLIKDLNEGKISVTDLNEDEIKNIEEYLKENDDGENNTDQPT
jgi:hypothetical protein